jgi:hypothetical protein
MFFIYLKSRHFKSNQIYKKNINLEWREQLGDSMYNPKDHTWMLINGHWAMRIVMGWALHLIY